MFEFSSIGVIRSQLYFSFNFICFEHIQSLPVISWFWFFLHVPIWALPIWAPICFPEVTYPRYDPGDVAIHLSLIPLSTSMLTKSKTILHTAETLTCSKYSSYKYGVILLIDSDCLCCGRWAGWIFLSHVLFFLTRLQEICSVSREDRFGTYSLHSNNVSACYF